MMTLNSIILAISVLLLGPPAQSNSIDIRTQRNSCDDLSVEEIPEWEVANDQKVVGEEAVTRMIMAIRDRTQPLEKRMQLVDHLARHSKWIACRMGLDCFLDLHKELDDEEVSVGVILCIAKSDDPRAVGALRTCLKSH